MQGHGGPGIDHVVGTCLYLVKGIEKLRSLSAELQHGLRRGLYTVIIYHPRNEDLAAELYLAPGFQKPQN